tara:strand:- start:1032 stop:2102 length:1071 start_codon:yes stop_codon:yes gene_type:complete
MSIFSIGKKIAGIDIRLGIPPSKKHFSSSEANKKITNVNRSSNRNSVYNLFRSQMSAAGGFARPSNFMVTFVGPVNYSTIAGEAGRRLKTSADIAGKLNDKSQVLLDLFCFSASIPERTITDEENQQYYGPTRAIAKNVQYSEATFDFYTSVNFEERLYFEAWQNAIVDPVSHNVGYYNDYAKNCMVVITPLTKTFTSALEGANLSGNIESDRETIRQKLGDTSGESAYQVVLLEAWPKTIAAIPMNYETKDQIVKMSVTIKYREFASTAINYLQDGLPDDMGELANNRFTYRSNVDTVRGGLLDNLPFGIGNIVGSVGRQIYEKVRRDLPIGRITGGRLFPKGLPDPKVIRDILY